MKDKTDVPAIGEREEIVLTKKNIKRISRRSGVSREHLKAMLEISDRRGIRRQVTYVVKAD